MTDETKSLMWALRLADKAGSHEFLTRHLELEVAQRPAVAVELMLEMVAALDACQRELRFVSEGSTLLSYLKDVLCEDEAVRVVREADLRSLEDRMIHVAAGAAVRASGGRVTASDIIPEIQKCFGRG